MWPMRSDMTRDECRKCLRCLELDAYGSMVSVLRAQGPFTSEKQKLLQELAKVLHISNERHRAEVRRAVNDEKLATIAEQLSGPNTGTDWTIEGHRAIPLLPRLKARSVFTTLANSLSLATVAANNKAPSICEKAEDIKDVENESQVELKLEKNVFLNTELLLAEDKLYDGKVIPEEVNESGKNVDVNSKNDNYSGIEKCNAVSEKRKSPSPLPTAPPNKILVVSSSSVSAVNHSTTEKGSLEGTIHSQTPISSPQCQNISLMPINISNSVTDSKEAVTQSSSISFVQAGKHVNTVTSLCTSNPIKNIGKTMQNILSPKITPDVQINNTQPDITDNAIFDNINSKNPAASQNLQKVLNSENTNSSATCRKRVTSMINPTAKPITAKSVTNCSHRVMTVCPSTTVSNGPGPPHAKQTTTLTCKKLPTTLNHQATAKMGVTLNSNKTVNISHPSSKIASKTNVIVIQKGHTKGVTLSHAGKEVLGKVIMGGKNLCVASQQSASSMNVLPHHVALNNGDQPMPSHTEPIKSNIKPGNTIVFNLRQDVLEKNKVLSQLLESSSVLNSDSKTVIQNANVRPLKEQSNSDLLIQDKELIVKTDTIITSIKDEKQHRKSKDVYMNANSYVINSIDPTIFLGDKEILINPNQLTNTQDDTINNIEIEDVMRSSEIDVFDTPLGSADINLENFQYLVEGNEYCVIRETSSLLHINHTDDRND